MDQVKNRFAGHEPLAAVSKVNTDSWLHGIDTKPVLDNYHYNPQGHTEVRKLLVDFSPITATRSQIVDGPIDVALVVDTSSSMGGPLAEIKQTAPELLGSIAGKSTSSRFALVDYRDFPERTGDSSDYAAALKQDFTTDISAVSGAVDALSIGYGGDAPETMYSGIHAALDLQWRDEAAKDGRCAHGRRGARPRADLRVHRPKRDRQGARA